MDDFGVGEPADLPDGSVVIRTGELADQRLRDNATIISRATPGLWAVCVQAHPTMTAEEIAFAMTVIGRRMRVTTAGELRARDFEVAPDLTDPSGVGALVLLGGPPNDETWARFRACFPAEATKNPAYGKSAIYGDGE